MWCQLESQLSCTSNRIGVKVLQLQSCATRNTYHSRSTLWLTDEGQNKSLSLRSKGSATGILNELKAFHQASPKCTKPDPDLTDRLRTRARFSSVAGSKRGSHGWDDNRRHHIRTSPEDWIESCSDYPVWIADHFRRHWVERVGQNRGNRVCKDSFLFSLTLFLPTDRIFSNTGSSLDPQLFLIMSGSPLTCQTTDRIIYFVMNAMQPPPC